jgi:hypothetical protein
MYAAFVDLDGYEGHVVDSSSIDALGTTDAIVGGLRANQFRLLP